VGCFRMNYDRVFSQASQIEELARDLGRRIDELDGLLAQVKSGWAGPASTRFQAKLCDLMNEMSDTKQAMESLASKIKKTARALKKEDERLAEEAESL